MLLCLSLYMLDVQSGSLWWYNQPPAEPAFCSSPAAFCPLELLLHPRPLIVYVYTTFIPIHLFLFSFLFLSSSPVVGRDICITPSCWGNSCRGIERNWLNGVNKRFHKGYPFILLSVTEGMKSLFKLIAWPPLCCTWQRLLGTMQLRSGLEKNRNNTGSPLVLFSSKPCLSFVYEESELPRRKLTYKCNQEWFILKHSYLLT